MRSPLKVIELFVSLKLKEKSIAKDVKDLKEVFYESCASVAGKKDQIEVAGALVVRKEVQEYSWPKSILLQEAALKVAKDLYKKKAKPVGSSISWAVEVAS